MDRGSRLGVSIVGVGMALLLGACGGGDTSQVAVTQGVSTVAGPGAAMSALPTASPAARDLAAPAPAEPARVLATSPIPAAPAPPATPAAAPASVASEVGMIYGVVTRGGQPVAGARMTLVAADMGERETTTDESGTYRFAAVPAGSYELLTYAESGATCDGEGCISAAWAERAELTVKAGQTQRVDVDG